MNVFNPRLLSELQSVGDDVRIGDYVKIVNPGKLSIGSHVIIDDFTFINAGAGSAIGDHVHIASFCCISGGGTFVCNDFSNFSARVSLFTGSDDFSGACLTGATVPLAFRQSRIVARITVGRHAILGTGATVLPGVDIGEGAAIGAMSLVKDNVDPWNIVAGIPAWVIGTRERRAIPPLEQALLAQEGTR